jgi:hypothetical protein
MGHRMWSWFRPKTEADIVGISSGASTSVRNFLPRVDDRHGLVPSVVLGRKFRVIVFWTILGGILAGLIVLEHLF